VIALTEIIEIYDQKLVANASNVQNILSLLFFECFLCNYIKTQVYYRSSTLTNKEFIKKMRFIYQ